MRKHGWQLPYHPLQVVAIAVFLALGFAFYVFFVPFVGGKHFQYVVMGLYTPLVTCVFFVYIWCAATDPGDPGIFKYKKNLKRDDYEGQLPPASKEISLVKEVLAATNDKQQDGSISTDGHNINDANNSSFKHLSLLAILFSWCPGKRVSNCCHAHDQFPEQQMSEEGMFYCSLCEVEVLKYSKHCRVCDKCVDGFDHHCRWINNCIGRKNYRWFFVLMISTLLLLIVQWSTGILVLFFCFLKRKNFSVEVSSKLGSSFSLGPFVVVVASCTFLAMVATLPLAQLSFFHILLVQKGISTYDYIIALREQEQEQEQEVQAVCNQQSPQMSQASSFTGLSSTSSFNAFHRGSWCTPPRLFLEDQFDVIPPEAGTSIIQANKKVVEEDFTKKNGATTVKISPWTLARLNAEEVSKAAAEARKKSKILQPVVKQEMLQGQDTDGSVGCSSGRMTLRSDNQKRIKKRERLPMDIPLEPLAKISASATDSNGRDLVPETSSSLAPLQLEARNAFRPNKLMPSVAIIASSPESSLSSPDRHPFHVSSETEESQVAALSSAGSVDQKSIRLSRSMSDGYEASGGEDSDRIPSKIVHRSSNLTNIIISSGRNGLVDNFKVSSSGSLQPYRRPK